MREPAQRKANLKEWLAKRAPADIKEATWHGVPMVELSVEDLCVIVCLMSERLRRCSDSASQLREAAEASQGDG